MPNFVRDIVKWKSFAYKHLIPIVQYVWQLYVIEVRYSPFQQTSSFLVSEIYRDRQTDMAKSTQLIMLIIYVYILWDLRRFLLGVTNFVANLIYHVQGKNHIMEDIPLQCILATALLKLNWYNKHPCLTTYNIKSVSGCLSYLHGCLNWNKCIRRTNGERKNYTLRL